MGQGGGKKRQFKKGSDWWKLSNWNRVMGSQPIRIQLRKFLQENLVENSCGKFLRENLAGNLTVKSYGTGRRGKSQFKKGSDWWKLSIWNRVMGSQPIRIQLRKFLQENLVENSCGKFLRENLAGNLAVKSYGTGRRGKSQFKKSSDWWKLSICNRVTGTQPIGIKLRKILKEILKGKSCGKKLWEILAGNSCRNIFAGTFWGKFLQGNVAENS